MHLNKILDQIKHHPSPTEAIDKLGKALEKHEGSLLEKGFQILKSELCANVYEAINGPHFDEEHARYAVEGMEMRMALKALIGQLKRQRPLPIKWA